MYYFHPVEKIHFLRRRCRREAINYLIYCRKKKKKRWRKQSFTQSFSTNLSGKYIGILTEFVVGRPTWQVTVENQFLESNDLYLDSREYYAAELREWATGSRALSAGALPKNRPLFGRKKKEHRSTSYARHSTSISRSTNSRLEKIDKNITKGTTRKDPLFVSTISSPSFLAYIS